MITELKTGPGVPSYEGPVAGGDDLHPGKVTWPDGSTSPMTWAEYLAVLKERWPDAISTREPCPHCGR